MPRANRIRDAVASRSAAYLLAALSMLPASSVLACETAPGGAAFPLRPNLGERFLADAAGRPFFMHGDTAWSLIGELTREEADLYLRDRHERGFNTLLVSLIEHYFSTNAPANAYGDAPFLGPAAFQAPNPDYFEHAAYILERACELGFVVLLTPAYAGVNGGPEGWYADMTAAGPDRLREYGRWIGERLGHLDNIVWVQGGDFDPPDKDLVRATVAGINEADPNALHTFHGTPDTRPLDYWAGDPWLAINNVYTYGDVHEASAREALLAGDRPFFLMESAYENEHEAAAYRVRMQAYHALLSGAAGHIYGNNPMWHFDGPGLFPAPGTWRDQLASPGARSMGVLRDVFESRFWWLLEPDRSRDFMIRGHGHPALRSVAALAEDGSYGLVYLPMPRTIVLDLGRLTGKNIRAEWRDPSSGEAVPIGDAPFAGGRHAFRPPERNAAGDPDWILEVTSEGSPSEITQAGAEP